MGGKRITTRDGSSKYWFLYGNTEKLCSEICLDRACCDYCPVQAAFRKLAEYEDMEEKNLFARFPYGMEQKYVYHLIDGSGGMMERLNAHRIHINRTAAGKPFYEIDGVDIDPEDFGVTVFLTKEEAWNALEKYWDGEYQEEEE